MDRGGFITPCGRFDEPLSHVRSALLVLTMALAAVVCAEISVERPLITHGITLDLVDAEWLRRMSTYPRPVYVLEIAADGSLTFDGAPCFSLPELRQRLDEHWMLNPVPELRVEPHPSARYEDFIEVLAVIKRAHVYPLCVDFGPQARSGAPADKVGLLCSAPPRE